MSTWRWKGVLEDSIELLLNLRRVKVNLIGKESSQTIRLSVSGERVVTAGDFQGNPEVEIFNAEQVLCTMTSPGSKLEIEAIVTRGRGYKTAGELKRKDTPDRRHHAGLQLQPRGTRSLRSGEHARRVGDGL